MVVISGPTIVSVIRVVSSVIIVVSSVIIVVSSVIIVVSLDEITRSNMLL